MTLDSSCATAAEFMSVQVPSAVCPSTPPHLLVVTLLPHPRPTLNDPSFVREAGTVMIYLKDDAMHTTHLIGKSFSQWRWRERWWVDPRK